MDRLIGRVVYGACAAGMAAMLLLSGMAVTGCETSGVHNYAGPAPDNRPDAVRRQDAKEKDDVSYREPQATTEVRGGRTGDKAGRESKDVARTDEAGAVNEYLSDRDASSMAMGGPAAPVQEWAARPEPEQTPSAGRTRMRRSMVVLQGEGPAEEAYNYNQAVVTPRKAEQFVQPAPRYFGRDRFEHKEVNPVRLAADEPVSTFSIDVDTASYSFVRRSIKEGSLPPQDAVRVEEMVNYFDYNYELPRHGSKPFKPTVAVYPTPWNPDTKLMHIGIKGLDIDKSKAKRANLVFLVDVSGSMQSADKLPLLVSSMKMMVNNLLPDDRVAIAVYAGAAGTVLEPTCVSDKHRIIEALERLRAGGSTAGGAGIQLAYNIAESMYDKRAVNRVILATDGDFNVGITDREQLKGFVERERGKGIFLSVLGFGMGNYNDSLMQALAQNGNGNAAYIDSIDEAYKVLVEEANSTLFTIAKDVKIQVEFNPERVAEYRLIGYETRMLNREDFRNDKVDAGDVGCGHSVTAIYEITEPDSPARLFDELRYGKGEKRRSRSRDDEYALLRIRYKLPDEDSSREITKAIDGRDEYSRISRVPEDIRFAAAVAGFGQLLKGSPYTGSFGYSDVERLASGATGRDMNGYRREFVRMVGMARSASPMASMR